MSSRKLRSNAVLNSKYEKMLSADEIKEEPESDITTEHYVLEYNKSDKIINIVQKHDVDLQNKTENESKNDGEDNDPDYHDEDNDNDNDYHNDDDNDDDDDDDVDDDDGDEDDYTYGYGNKKQKMTKKKKLSSSRHSRKEIPTSVKILNKSFEPYIQEINEPDDNDDVVQEEYEHVCGKCYQTFNSYERYRAHSLYCKNQSKIVKNLENMKKNLKFIEQESIELHNNNMCFCCKEVFDTAHTGHIRCSECTKSFKSNTTFERHVFLIHSDISAYPCDTCNARCPSEIILKLHEKAHQRGKPFACKLCGEDFTRKYHLNRHLLYGGCKNYNSGTSYLCKVCSKKFQRLDNLRQHLKQHLGQDKKTKDYPCPYCDKAFYGTSTLNIHIRTHTGERPFSCDLCDYSFPSKPALRKHRRTHTGERPYQCTECCRAFAAKEILNRHMKTHTGEKPHACNLCDKKFIQATQLKAHLVTHQKRAMKMKQIKCHKCKLKFDKKELLNQHMREQHFNQDQNGEKPYCHQCKKTFMNEGGLRRHITRIHMQEDFIDIDYPFKDETYCKICNKDFDNKKSLQFHMLKFHDNATNENNDDQQVELIGIEQSDIDEIQGKTDDNQWQCQFCPWKFKENKKLLEHIQEIHGAVIFSVTNEEKNNDILIIKTEETSKEENINDEKQENIEVIDVCEEDSIVLEYIEETAEQKIIVPSSSKTNVLENDKISDKIIIDTENQNHDELNIQITNSENNKKGDHCDEDEFVWIKVKKPKLNKKPSTSPSGEMTEKLLVENINKLLDLLIEKDMLEKFGYPNAPVDEVLLKVIKNCGHNISCDNSCDYTTKLRDYVKLLFTVVIDNDSIKELLNNYPIDKVISQVLGMAD